MQFNPEIFDTGLLESKNQNRIALSSASNTIKHHHHNSSATSISTLLVSSTVSGTPTEHRSSVNHPKTSKNMSISSPKIGGNDEDSEGSYKSRTSIVYRIFHPNDQPSCILGKSKWNFSASESESELSEDEIITGSVNMKRDHSNSSSTSGASFSGQNARNPRGFNELVDSFFHSKTPSKRSNSATSSQTISHGSSPIASTTSPASSMASSKSLSRRKHGIFTELGAEDSSDYESEFDDGLGGRPNSNRKKFTEYVGKSKVGKNKFFGFLALGPKAENGGSSGKFVQKERDSSRSPKSAVPDTPKPTLPISDLTASSGMTSKRPPIVSNTQQGQGRKFKDLLLPPSSRRASIGTLDVPHVVKITPSEEIPSVSELVLVRKTASVGSANSDISRASSDQSLREKYGVCSKLLGSGSFSKVKLCCPIGTDLKYAVKEFRKKHKDESSNVYIKKVQAEFCIASSLSHENIVKCKDLIKAEKTWCLVMEFCPDGDLFTRISNASLTNEQEQACYFKQLVNGVSYLHSTGVSHRDLKPENILLSHGGRILKITDFGVSTVFKYPFGGGGKEFQKGVTGSGPYIAPEEYDVQSYDSEAVDIWALGVIGFVIVSNSIPWKSALATDPRFKLYTTHHKFPPFEKLHQGVRDLLYSLLIVDPRKRPTIVDVQKDRWIISSEACTVARLDNVLHSHASCK